MTQSNTQTATANHQWVIYSEAEATLRDGCGYWSTETASWVAREQATVFPAGAVGIFALPMSLLQDRRWIDLWLDDQKDEDALCKALDSFCADKALPNHSADELYFEVISNESARHPNAVWLQQFIEQWERVVES